MRNRSSMYVLTYSRAMGTTLLLIVALLCPLSATAQQSPAIEIEGLPDWLVLEKGRVEFEKKEYGRAMYFYREAISLRHGEAYPEAEEAIGDVYRADNETRLAEKQYRRALESGSSLELPEARFRVIYKLADLYLEQERYKDFSDELLRIVEENRYFSDPDRDGIRQSMRRLYRNQGFDALVRYYRIDALFAARAHSDLGWFYYRTGLSKEQGILHLLFAADIVLGRIVEELRLADPEYEYVNLTGFLERALAGEGTRLFLLESGFFRSLYYLACASHASGEMLKQARELWAVLSRTTDAGEYAGLAARQLAAPWTEPIINPSSRDIEHIEYQ